VLGSLALAVEAPSRDSRYTENIFVVNADGTGRRNLTLGSSPAQRVLYALSPDGRTLAYGRHGSIEVLPVKGGKARTLVSFSGQNGYSDVGWSRDGKLIAFQMCCDPLGVGVVRPDGTSLSTIPYVSNPAWLPGSRLAFLVGVEIQREIATANPDGSERRSVLYAKPRESFSGLTVSPNGRKFAFTSSSDQGEWLTSVGPMGIPPDRIARGALEHSWSPTSRRLVFVTEDDGLVTVASDGSGRRRYRAIRSLYPEFPAWSPDGTRIAFRAKYGRLFVMNLRHGSLRVVARSVAREQPLWSPNGRRLYYVASRRS
jgi:Tol biopolymer transport system component